MNWKECYSFEICTLRFGIDVNSEDINVTGVRRLFDDLVDFEADGGEDGFEDDEDWVFDDGSEEEVLTDISYGSTECEAFKVDVS